MGICYLFQFRVLLELLGVLIQTTGKSIDRDTIDTPEIFFAVVVQPVLNPANFLDPI